MRLQRSTTIGAGQFELAPVSDDEQPSISRDQALGAYQRLGLPDYEKESGRSPDIYLAHLTAPHFGPLDAKGQPSATIVDRLTWVITFPGIGCHPAGGAGEQSAPESADTSCAFTIFVDAKDGTPLLSSEGGL